MPRRKRPPPPIPGSLPLRAIAPRLDIEGSGIIEHDGLVSPQNRDMTPLSSRHSTTGSDDISSSCGVPRCSTVDCLLPTHLSYGRQRRLLLLHHKFLHSSSRSSNETTIGEKTPLTSSPPVHCRESMTLPIDDHEDPKFQDLFFRFWNEIADDLFLVFRTYRRDPGHIQKQYKLALASPLYCMSCIASAHYQDIKNINASLGSNNDALTYAIYSKLAVMCASKIEAFESADLDIVIMGIVNLCQYDLKLDRPDNLVSHHAGLIALVTRCGGVHNLGFSLPFFLQTDRFLAIRANKSPSFTAADVRSPLTTALEAALKDRSIGVELSAFDGYLESNVQTLAADAAYLLDLTNEVGIVFEYAKVPKEPHPKTEFWFFLRENIEMRHATLNARLNDKDSSARSDTVTAFLSRCVLAALKIVVYYITTDNKFATVCELMSQRLWNLLAITLTSQQGDNASSQTESAIPSIDFIRWTDNMPMLLWLLYVCALPCITQPSMNFADYANTLISHTSTTSSSSDSGRRGSQNTDIPTQSLVSPSTPRRQRYLARLILEVVEHLFNLRSSNGIQELDMEVAKLLDGFIWDSRRLGSEFSKINTKINEASLARGAGLYMGR